jgi:hypothetical protein
LPTTMLELPVSVRDVVTNCVAEDVVQCLGLGDVGARLANDSDELALIV